jgi:hypothetical protein
MRDGIVAWWDAKSLGFDINKHVKLDKPQWHPRILSNDTVALDDPKVPRKLTQEEIDYYKRIDKTQNWKDSNDKKAVNNLWKDDVIWELPESGDGYIIYNRNDLAGRKEYGDDKGLDEIGTKETIERSSSSAKPGTRTTRTSRFRSATSAVREASTRPTTVRIWTEKHLTFGFFEEERHRRFYL